jgi:hypothetical protein
MIANKYREGAAMPAVTVAPQPTMHAAIQPTVQASHQPPSLRSMASERVLNDNRYNKSLFNVKEKRQQ